MKSSKSRPLHTVQIGSILLFCILLINGCRKEKPPIKIGFVGNLTGRETSLALGARNGALLAVEDINHEGGINGHKIQLIVKDDRLDPNTAVTVDRELIQEGVAAIIGHIHSNMSLSAIPIVNQVKMLMLSPVSASSKLSGVDDYFFKINPPSSQTSFMTAKYAYDHGMREIAVLYDLKNKNYSEPKLVEFTHAFESMGGRVTAKSFISGTGVAFPDFVREMMRSNPNGYYIIANAFDTAMICQHLRKIDSSNLILITPFAYDPELLQNGGSAVEGVILAHPFNKDSREPAFIKFREEFFERYKAMPYIWEKNGYEAVMVLAQALSQNPDPKQLKETVLKIGRFKGLQGDIVFDRYGDNQRKPLLLTIRKGAFVEIR